MLRTLEAGFSRREVVDMFKCSQSTISRVLSEKEVIVKDAEDNVHGKRENLLYYKELEKVLSVWAREMKNSNKLITASTAKQKAEELALAMGFELKPSTGWLYKWKERESITFAKRTKEPEDTLKDYLDRKEQLLQTQSRDQEEKSKRLKLDEESQSESTKDKGKVKHLQSPAQESSVEDNENKPRTKREYIKRLPLFDASGAICRSRKEKTFLTLLQKLEILERLKNGEKRPNLIVEYNLSSSAMSQIVTDEEKILKLAAGGQNLHMKRIRGGIFKDGEAELNAWVQEKLELGESLTRTHIKNKAKEIAERLNIEFKASTGWLEKWKVRMNLDFNENQKLQRKMPKLIPSDEELDNSQVQFELSDSFYDGQDSEIFQKPIKEEQMENDFLNDMETSDGYLKNDIESTDIKPELLTPQQFYLNAIRSYKQNTNKSNDKQEKVHQSNFVEENDVKPFIAASPHISLNNEVPTGTRHSHNNLISVREKAGFNSSKNKLSNGFIKTKSFAQESSFRNNSLDTQREETLHEQVLLWLNQYKIAPGPATELLNILEPHLCSVAKNFSNPVQQNYNSF